MVGKLPKGIRYRQVTATALTGTSAAVRPYLSMACNHCGDPVCKRVCPVNAYSKLDDGAVVQDHAKCIGCMRCVVACPYGAPQYNEANNKVEKCDLCQVRLVQGGLPACVEGCPTQALRFGDLAQFDALSPQFARVFPDPLLLRPSLRVIPSSARHVAGKVIHIGADVEATNGGIIGDMLQRIKTR